tara:strand:- start:334 stop:546 length:213 start_codon:yes stop_codon:yes gene_type:complete
MAEIIDLERVRLSQMQEQELIVVAIEKAAQQLLEHTALLKELSKKVADLEENVKERENEIEDIFRTLEAT